MGAIDKLRSSRPVDLLGPGDMISVTSYEAGSGLFNGRRAADPGTSTDPAPAPTGSSGETPIRRASICSASRTCRTHALSASRCRQV